MLHSPTYASAWNSFLKTVTQDLGVPPKMPELIMCVVGELNNAPYETFSHSPRFLAAGGTQAHLNALSDLPRAIEDTKLFDTQERAALPHVVPAAPGNEGRRAFHDPCGHVSLQ